MKPYITIHENGDVIQHDTEDAAKDYASKALMADPEICEIFFARILGRIFPERVARVEGVCTTRTSNEGVPTP